ncbi:MAG: DUF5696 domain-containing protein, partial [Firmicutes bacterium]|nr:DUF5696 domain-containing protein [Bacillota bacterium]
QIKYVDFPSSMSFEEPSPSWYTLLCEEQGLMIPNTWETPLGGVAFDGMFETAGSYMPWFGQVKDGDGYIAICVTPYNGRYKASHPAGGPFTHVGVRFEPSLGLMDTRRIMRYTFMSECDYVRLSKVYRKYAKETGLFKSLCEKAAKNPSVHKLVGSSVVHVGIKKNVVPESGFYDKEHPENNYELTPFSEREREVRLLSELGVEKLYLHLDGWGQPGYDNEHPDYTPACLEAGGWEGMKSLADALHECGYLFGIHDQYRDYYERARTYDPDYACMNSDGTIPGHSTWAGGRQKYLCATQAPYYVRRNFEEIKRRGVELDCAYLDVFTCNEGDECANPRHKMTRRECLSYRSECFEYLLSNGILTSSEEVADWSMRSLVFCHYAPYDFMMRKGGEPKRGIPVPLFSLVYHDCVIVPWIMDTTETEDYMLYALINRGIPYLLRDGAYPGTDGAFGEGNRERLQNDIRRCRVMSELHEKIAFAEMINHELLDENGKVQRSTFEGGVTVTADLARGTYEIDIPK